MVDIPAAGIISLPYEAGANFRNDRAHVRGGAALGAHLHDALVFIDGLQQQFALVRILAARLLDINVLACRHGQNRHRGMPMIRGGDGHNIERRICQHLAKIFQPFGNVHLPFGGLFQSLGDGTVVHIANAGDFHPRQTGEARNMREAAAIGANYRRRNAVIRADDPGGFHGLGLGVGQRTQTRRQAQSEARRAGLFDKIAAVDGIVHTLWMDIKTPATVVWFPCAMVFSRAIC